MNLSMKFRSRVNTLKSYSKRRNTVTASTKIQSLRVDKEADKKRRNMTVMGIQLRDVYNARRRKHTWADNLGKGSNARNGTE